MFVNKPILKIFRVEPATLLKMKLFAGNYKGFCQIVSLLSSQTPTIYETLYQFLATLENAY